MNVRLGILLLIGVGACMLGQPAGGLLAQEQTSVVGQFLVAAPNLDDPNFSHTVVYMVQHDATGAMGLVINRVAATGPLKKLLADVGIKSTNGVSGEVRLHSGGPVDRSQGFVLHGTDYRNDSTIEVDGKIAMSVSHDVLRDIAAGKGPQHSLLAFGYAGWAPEQLENEIAAGAWLVVPADEALLFDDHDDTKWRRALKRTGIDL